MGPYFLHVHLIQQLMDHQSHHRKCPYQRQSRQRRSSFPCARMGICISNTRRIKLAGRPPWDSLKTLETFRQQLSPSQLTMISGQRIYRQYRPLEYKLAQCNRCIQLVSIKKRALIMMYQLSYDFLNYLHSIWRGKYHSKDCHSLRAWSL